MPKRSFDNRVLGVIRRDQETKRVVQTRQQFIPQPDLQTHPIVAVHDNTNDSSQNYWCWSINHNTAQFWPVSLTAVQQGVTSGQSSGQTGRDNNSRIGTEVACSGVSLKFMVWIKPQIPYVNLNCYLIKYPRGDPPTQDKLYKNYTGNKALDVMDTRRYRIVKKWKWFLPQVQPTTAGKEIYGTAEGIVANDMNTEKMDGAYTVVKYSETMTPAQWDAHIAEKYPDYRILTSNDAIIDSYTEAHILSLGFDHTARTLWHRYVADPAFPFIPTQEYMITSDFGAQSDWRDQMSAVATNSGSLIIEPWTTNPLGVANQVVLVKKNPPIVGLAKADDDQIQLGIDKKCSLWIPGKYFGNRGYITYKEDGNAIDGHYDYCLMFRTYANYKTWDYTTGATSTSYPEMARISDFVQIMSFKDP